MGISLEAEALWQVHKPIHATEIALSRDKDPARVHIWTMGGALGLW